MATPSSFTMSAANNFLSPLSVLLLLLAMVQGCHGMCMPLDALPTVEEEMQKVWDGTDGGALIARLTFAYDDDGTTRSTISTAPCSFEVYDEDAGSYVYIDDAVLYTVEEVFAGGTHDGRNVSAGDKLPIVWMTDTLGRQFLPDYLGNDPDGFLGMMYPMSSCHQNGATTYGETYPGPVQPYSMNECQMRMNRKWSEVSEAEREVLRSGVLSASPVVSPTSASPTESPVVSPTSASPTKSPVVSPPEPDAVIPDPGNGGGDPAMGSSSSVPTKSPVVASPDKVVVAPTTKSPTAAPTPFDPLADENSGTIGGSCGAILFATMVAMATSLV